MQNIVVGRYTKVPEAPPGAVQVADEWQGWIEPEDRSWIVFVEHDGTPHVFLNRDEAGGVITD